VLSKTTTAAVIAALILLLAIRSSPEHKSVAGAHANRSKTSIGCGQLMANTQISRAEGWKSQKIYVRKSETRKNSQKSG
jgi:hypothetical protein